MKEIIIGYIDRNFMEQMRETIHSFFYGFPDNSYIWIQYKDGSSWVHSGRYEADYFPSLDQSKILYIENWW